MNNHSAAPDRIPTQFSVRDLLKVTFVVAVLLSIGVLCRGSTYLSAFASSWALATLVPIVAVWLSRRWHLMSWHGLARGSIVAYVASLCVPALALGGDAVFGWMAWLLSFAGILLFADWQLGTVGERMWYPVACMMGAVVNVAFVAAYVAHLLSSRWPKALTLTRRASNLGTALALLVLVPLALSSELHAIYPGYGLWAASLLALVPGAYHTDDGQRR